MEVESDAAEVVKLLKKEAEDLTDLSNLVAEVDSLVFRLKENISFLFSPRLCNKAAHCLARATAGFRGYEDLGSNYNFVSSNSEDWFCNDRNAVPPWLISIIDKEVSGEILVG